MIWGGNHKGPDYLALQKSVHFFPNEFQIGKYYKATDTSGDLAAIEVIQPGWIFKSRLDPVTFLLSSGNISREERCLAHKYV